MPMKSRRYTEKHDKRADNKNRFFYSIMMNHEPYVVLNFHIL